MKENELARIAGLLVAGDKGLLAMDESTPTCNRRFAPIGIPQTEEARRAYRELIVTTPGLGESISGATIAATSPRRLVRNTLQNVESRFSQIKVTRGDIKRKTEC